MNRLERLSRRIFPSVPAEGRIGSLEYNVWLAQVMGLPLTGLRDETPQSRLMVLSYGITVFVSISLAYTLFEVNDLWRCWPNLDLLTQNCCLLLTHIAEVLKALNLFYRLPELNVVSRKLKFVTQKYVVSDKQHETFLSGEFENKIFLTAYISVVGFTALLCVALMLFNPEHIVEQTFPFRVNLPKLAAPSFRVAYMSVSVVVLALQIVATDFLNVTLINHLRFQLKVLNLSFNELMLDTVNGKNSLLESPHRRLQSIIDHHCTLREMRNDVERIFSFSILIQFLTSVVIIAMTGFQATVHEDPSNTTLLVSCYCGCISFELFLYCWFGNDVFEQSKTLSISGFSSSWYQLDQKFRKSLLLFLLNAQEPFNFTAGGFVALSLPSFAAILSRSYTYIMVLRQMYGK